MRKNMTKRQLMEGAGINHSDYTWFDILGNELIIDEETGMLVRKDGEPPCDSPFEQCLFGFICVGLLAILAFTFLT